MYRVHHRAALIVGLILLLGGGVTWGGRRTRQRATAWGTRPVAQMRSPLTPSVKATPPSAPMRSRTTSSAAQIPPSAPTRSRATSSATLTPPSAPTQSTPMTSAITTPPSETMRSLPTPSAATISPAASTRSMRNTTGTGNIAVGYHAGARLQSGNNNIYVSHTGMVDESNTIRLGSVQTSTFIAGITGAPVSGNAVLINSQGQLGIQASSARYKHDIQPMGTRSRGLRQLRPATFRMSRMPKRATVRVDCGGGGESLPGVDNVWRRRGNRVRAVSGDDPDASQ